MKPLTRECVEKAEGDFTCVQREWHARKSPVYDALCFHAQQCSEKYLKACLQEYNVEFEKTHNLLLLLEKVLSVAPLLAPVRDHLGVLNVYAVAFRYPGSSAERSDASAARQHCMAVRDACRCQLQLPAQGG
jgi:HEPN domain-containing protein